MPKFGKLSTKNLSECDPRLQKVFDEVIKNYDCSIICGHREESIQNYLYSIERTQLQFPNGKHNSKPSMAVDAIPYPVVLPNRKTRPETYEKDLGRLYYFAGYVIATALQMEIKIKFGGDWNMNNNFLDNNFDDLFHFELIVSRQINK